MGFPSSSQQPWVSTSMIGQKAESIARPHGMRSQRRADLYQIRMVAVAGPWLGLGILVHIRAGRHQAGQYFDEAGPTGLPLSGSAPCYGTHAAADCRFFTVPCARLISFMGQKTAASGIIPGRRYCQAARHYAELALVPRKHGVIFRICPGTSIFEEPYNAQCSHSGLSLADRF